MSAFTDGVADGIGAVIGIGLINGLADVLTRPGTAAGGRLPARRSRGSSVLPERQDR